MLLSSTFLIDGLTTQADYDFKFYVQLAVLALVAGFIFGGLATGLALMLAGAPVARIAGDRLQSHAGVALAVGIAVLGIAAFHAIAGQDELFFLMAAACFALPAAFLYRRQVLLERAFERP